MQRRFEEEVLDCIKLCSSDNAPGPDGFLLVFIGFLGCTERRHNEHCASFHSPQVFEKSLNATYVAHIP